MDNVFKEAFPRVVTDVATFEAACDRIRADTRIVSLMISYGGGSKSLDVRLKRTDINVSINGFWNIFCAYIPGMQPRHPLKRKATRQATNERTAATHAVDDAGPSNKRQSSVDDVSESFRMRDAISAILAAEPAIDVNKRFDTLMFLMTSSMPRMSSRCEMRALLAAYKVDPLLAHPLSPEAPGAPGGADVVIDTDEPCVGDLVERLVIADVSEPFIGRVLALLHDTAHRCGIDTVKRVAACDISTLSILCGDHEARKGEDDAEEEEDPGAMERRRELFNAAKADVAMPAADKWASLTLLSSIAAHPPPPLSSAQDDDGNIITARTIMTARGLIKRAAQLTTRDMTLSATNVVLKATRAVALAKALQDGGDSSDTVVALASVIMAQDEQVTAAIAVTCARALGK